MDISKSIYFRDVVMILEKMKDAPNVLAKEKYLHRYVSSFKKFRSEFRNSNSVNANAEEDGSTSFYCVLRCLLPSADHARPAYGMQINTLGKTYIKILQLSDDSRDTHRLIAQNYTGIGDYAEIVYSVLKSRCRHEPSDLKLYKLHEMLDEIANGDRRTTEKILTELHELTSAKEQMWFIRLLLKSMRLGIGEQRILGVLHEQARELYQRCSNLWRVCCLLANNDFSMVRSEAEDIRIKLEINLDEAIVPFQHIRPMLCELFPGNIEKLLEADVMFVETKMDGERFQLHHNCGRFKFFSRNGIDYTANFGDSYKSGNLTSHLSTLLPIGMESMIIDGEMMIWDENQLRYREKSENTDVKHLSGNSSWRPCFVAYDLLYFNGRSLLDMPYIHRHIKLNELLKEKQGVLQLMKPTKIMSLEHFRELFQAALDTNEEGVVLKKQSSVYRPGMRNGGGWYKIKADYIDGLTTEFDLLIIGGFYNRTRTFVESFLLGVLKYVTPLQVEVFSVGRVQNVTRNRAVLNDTLKPYWHPISTEPPPIWYHYVNTSADGRPDVWIEPKNSLILQIKATDLNPSGAFFTKKALHFPRIQSWRNDKLWNECMTIDEYTEFSESKKHIRKINKRELRLEDLTNERKRTKVTPAQKRKLAIESYERRFDPQKVDTVSGLFESFSFCILSASVSKAMPPEAVKALIVQHGGEIVENPMPKNPKCISVAGDLTFRVQQLIKSCRHNIVSLEWVLRSVESGEMTLNATDMVAMTKELEAEFKAAQTTDTDVDTDVEANLEADAKDEATTSNCGLLNHADE